MIIAGIDEAGRGPLAGPVVSAAVILKKGQRLPGLNDSKKLSEEKREELYKKITENAISYSVIAIDHEYIDRHNILKAVQKANKDAVKALDPQPDLVLIDGRDKQIITIPFKTIIKGDTFVREIMAASILAKVTRDRLMKKFAKKYPQYAFEKHKGYGTRLHTALLEKHKPCAIHRKSYTPVTNLLK
jgi:ribonuclease HII